MLLELLSGMPILVYENIHIKQFTIREIIKEIGMDVYNTNLSLLLIDEDYIEEVLDDYEIEINPYEFVLANCISSEEFADKICGAYSMFLDCDVVFDDEYGIVLVADKEPVVLNLEMYNYIQNTLRNAHSIPEPKKYAPGNEMAKEFIKKLKRNKRNARKIAKSDFTLADIVSGVKWKSGETYESIFNLTMYQLYDGLDRLQIIDNYENTMLGVYTGNIDTKKNDIKVSWFKTIEKDG